MATAWLVPSETDSAPDAVDGDYLLRPAGDLYEIGSVASGCTWIGTVAASLLPELPQVDGPQQAPEQEKVLLALRGVESAETHRGG